MNASVIRCGGLWVFVVLTATGMASAAGPDLRLVNAIAAQNAQGVRALLDEGIDVNAARADGATALLWAAHWDDLATAARLIRAGAHVNATDDHGVTPLARACENGSVAMVATLLAAHADANAAQASGLTPLMTAARTGTVAVVEALLAHGADVNATTTE
ncbi:MAG: ankyrin repeat domain-containing protein, partial [Vicinamibacterales bacterium]